MKKVVFVLAIVCSVLLSSCKPNDKNLNKKLIGDWKVYQVDFNEDYYFKRLNLICGLSIKSENVVKVAYDFFYYEDKIWDFDYIYASHEHDFEDDWIWEDEEPQMYYIIDGKIYIGDNNKSYLQYKNGELIYYCRTDEYGDFDETMAAADFRIKFKRYKANRNL